MRQLAQCLAFWLVWTMGALASEIVTGEGSVLVEGKPAARSGDMAGETIVQGGSPDVMIGGAPAVRAGDMTPCGVVTGGSNSVLINGRPMAGTGSPVSGDCR